jgi:hypothetical protein
MWNTGQRGKRVARPTPHAYHSVVLYKKEPLNISTEVKQGPTAERTQKPESQNRTSPLMYPTCHLVTSLALPPAIARFSHRKLLSLAPAELCAQRDVVGRVCLTWEPARPDLALAQHAPA